MDDQSKTGHVYRGKGPFPDGGDGEDTYRARNAQLVAALRSGQFAQIRGTLQRINLAPNAFVPTIVGQCCLGVACIIAGTSGEVTVYQSIDLHMREVSFGTMSDGGLLRMQEGTPPDGVVRWYGWTDENPYLFTIRNGAEQSYSATRMNDKFGWDFNAIADAFERTFVTYTVEDEGLTVQAEPTES